MSGRNTKQKEVIYTCILNDKSHPTISDIVKMVRNIDSCIGQATVYRNVNKLLAEGKICKLTGINKNVRYDGDVSSHSHLVCVECGEVLDLYDNNYEDIKETINDKYSFLVSRISTTYAGICQSCQNKEKR